MNTKPTIHDLEQILKEGTQEITLNPDGSVVVGDTWEKRATTAEALNADLENQISELMAGMDQAEAERDQAVADAAALRILIQDLMNTTHSTYGQNIAMEKLYRALSAEHPGDKLLAIKNAALEYRNATQQYDDNCDEHGEYSSVSVSCKAACLEARDKLMETLDALNDPNP